MTELLNKLYNDPTTGFIGIRKLYAKAKLQDPTITYAKVRDFIKSNETAQVHSRVQKKKNHIPIFGRIGHYQADLTFYDQFTKQNRGYHILLTAIEVNSRRGFAIPLKKKTGEALVDALNKLIHETLNKNKITVLQFDRGNEFTNAKVEKFLKHNGIILQFCTAGDKKCMGKAERFNRTIKSMINKYMTSNNTSNWIDVLDKIVQNYNNSYHREIKMNPNDVSELDERLIIGEAFDKARERNEIILEIGDKVRIPLPKNTFSKEGANFSNEIYTVSKVNKITVKLVDDMGDFLSKNYRIDEVLKVPEGSKYVNTTEIKKARKEAKVKRIVEQKEGLNP